ncbi:MAG: hypothetical protein ACFFBD_23420 [Candidatus Hodarchaeota archaeon]
MVFNWLNYFTQAATGEKALLWPLFTVVLIILEFIILIYFFKAYRNFRQNLPSLESVWPYLITMVGLAIWNLGEMFAGITQILTIEYTIFQGGDNFFFPLGIAVALTFFISYLQTILQTQKRSRLYRLIAHRIFYIISGLALLVTLVLVVRFLSFGFMPSTFRSDTDSFVTLMIIFVSLIVALLIIIGSLQLYQEYKAITSKLNRFRLIMYQIFFGSVAFAILNVGVYFILDMFTPIVGGLQFFLNTPIFLVSLPAMLGLYYGMFTPLWLQKKVDVLPSK